MKPFTANIRSTVGSLRRRFGPRGVRSSSAPGSQALVDGEFLSKLNRLSLQIGRDLIAGLMGEHRAVRRTSGIEFFDHREYTVGDDLRRVDWNAYARLGTLHVRQAQAEHDTVLYLLVDSSPSMEFGEPTKFFAARRLAAALGYIALAHLDRVVMSTPGSPGWRGRVDADGQMAAPDFANTVTTASRQSAVQSPRWSGRAETALFFRHLQELRAAEAANTGEVLAEWGTRRGQGRVAVILSDLLTDGYQAGVRQLVGAGFAVTVLHTLSPEELRPPEEGDLQLVDSETGEELEIHLGDESLREYDRRLQVWLSGVREWASANGVGYLLVQSDWDVERVLLETLRARGVTS